MVRPMQSHRPHPRKVRPTKPPIHQLATNRNISNDRASEEAEFKDKVHFVKFDVDELPELSQELGIRAMPTFLFYKNGNKVDEMIGANPPVLLQTLRKHNA